MATTEQKQEAQVTIDANSLKDILAAAIAEGRKPVVDESLEARKARDKARLQEQRRLSEQEKQITENSCSHLREDGTSRIAWITNYNRQKGRLVTEGFCQYCNKAFTEDLPEFKEFVRIPTGARFSI